MVKLKNPYALLIFTLIISLFFGCDEGNEDPGPEIVTGAILNAEVGGPTQPNQVYVDLSSKSQTPVNRSSWDLAFNNGSEFRVKLNASVGMMAMALDKNDLADVTAVDTAGLGAKLSPDAVLTALFLPTTPSWISEASSWVDSPDGDLSKTAIAEIASSDDANNVYIINRGQTPDETARGWLKVRILRSDNGYMVQYAEIDAGSFNEIEISKDEDFNFTYLNFEDGAVDVEPEKSAWDFAFSTFTTLTPFGATSIPYLFNDYIILNPNAVGVAEVMIEGETTYETFDYASTSALEFVSTINAIGSSWRTVAQPGADQETGVNTDRFYVFSDAEGNYYKLRFTQMLDAQTGERGHPQIEYELLENK